MSPPCTRFDDEALPRLEAGLALDEAHIAHCPDCLAARVGYEQVLASLALTNRLAPPERPPADWRERVLAAVDRRAATRRSRVWWLPAAGLVAAGLAVFLLTPPRPAPPGLSQKIVAGTTSSRGGGETARPGDHLVLRAATGGVAHAELRLYLNRERLVLRCSDETPPCRLRNGRLEADWLLANRGSYLPLLLLSPVPLPGPGAGFEADTAAALAAGARVEPGREVAVR